MKQVSFLGVLGLFWIAVGVAVSNLWLWGALGMNFLALTYEYRRAWLAEREFREMVAKVRALHRTETNFPLEKGSRWEKSRVAEGLLLFLCKSDVVEATVGDLMEEFDTVSRQRSKTFSNVWFVWELTWLAVAMARRRVTKAALGPLLEKYFKPSK